MIETADEIDSDDIAGSERVGVTAGASTPEWLIQKKSSSTWKGVGRHNELALKLIRRLSAHRARSILPERTNRTFTAGFYYEKRLSLNQRRFLKAVETLAKVKRLLSESGYRDQQAKHKRGQSRWSLNSF